MTRYLWLVRAVVVHIVLYLGVTSGAVAEPAGATRTLQNNKRQMLPNGVGRQLAVAWNDSTSGSGTVQGTSVVSPWEFETRAEDVGPDSVLRFAEGRLYAVSPRDGTITAIAEETWTTWQVYSLGVDSEPQDIAVISPDTAYVTRRLATHLLRLDLGTGATEEVVDRVHDSLGGL